MRSLSELYWGVTRLELNESSVLQRLLGMVHPRFRFPHRGYAKLGKALELSGWRTIMPHEVLSIERMFDDAFTQFTLNADRRLALLGGGEPIRLTLKDGSTLYMMFAWSFLTGFTRNGEWLENLRRWVRGDEDQQPFN